MKRIELTQGKWALVDDEDFDRVNKLNWQAVRAENGFYAKRTVHTPRPNRKSKAVPMANFIMNPPKGFIVDHIDGDSLNNQKSNLRICTQADNVRNRKAHGASGYVGVHKHKDGWQVQLRVGGKAKYLGKFADKEEAARVYNEAAPRLIGPFARLNNLG